MLGHPCYSLPDMDRDELGKYIVRRELGRGAMGIVYLATDTTLDRLVALKVLRSGLLATEADRARFRHEAQFIAKLRHPNIVRVHAFEDVDEELLIDMEYIEGCTLDEAAKNKSFSPEEIALLARCILSALAEAHEKSHLHRDVKPGNILIDKDGTPMLVDFGLARIAHQESGGARGLTHSSAIVVGTPRYLPPEAWNGETPNASWDVYALGIVLYELATGKPAFDATTTLGLVKQIATTTLPPVATVSDSIPANLATAIDAMVGDPTIRPKDATQALAFLNDVPAANSAAPAAATHAPRKAINRGEALRGIAQRLRTNWAAGWILFVAVFIAWTLWPGAAPPPQQTSMSPEREVPIQDRYPSFVHALRESVPAESEAILLRRTLNEDPGRVYEVIMNGRSPINFKWWHERTMPGGSRTAILFGERSIASLQWNSVAGAYKAAGHWAAVIGEAPAHGSISGSAVGLGENAMGFQLDLTDTSETAHDMYINRVPAETEHTDTWFYWQLERQPQVQPLMYTFYSPAQLPWIDRIDQELPAFGKRRSWIPYAGDHDRPVIDGHVDERIWFDDWVGPEKHEGNMSSIPRTATMRMLLRYRDEGLYVAADTQTTFDISSYKVELYILTGFGETLSSATEHRFSIMADGTGLYARRPDRSEYTGPIFHEAMTTFNNGKLDIEFFIPFSGLGIEAAPGSDVRWRVHMAIAEEKEGEAVNAKRVTFGHLTGSSIIHAPLMRFADPDPEISGLKWRRE